MGELHRLKRVLYFAPEPQALERLVRELERVPAATVDTEGHPYVITFESVAAQLTGVTGVDAALARLHSEYFNLAVIDLRGPGAPAAGLTLLDALAAETELELRYGLHRLVALVPAEPSERGDRLLVELGARGVGHVVRVSEAAGDAALRLAEALVERLTSEHDGRRALCVSGGGITGLYYELAVLKCLDDCCSGNAVNTFDMYFGISAGAVISGFLSVGYSVDEVMAAIAGDGRGRIPSLDLSLLRWRHLNWRDFFSRVGRAAGELGRWLPRFATGRTKLSPASLFFEYSDFIGPFFRTDAYEQMLREILTAPGATNTFSELPRRLFIGATDQDTRKHVIFGSEGHDAVPISRAIQASMSLNPAFASTCIDGRYYEDGAVTHTSNFVEAIRRGADLLFVLDPLVPFVSRAPGYARRRGLLYNVDQDVRSLSFSRFSNTRQWVLRQHPEVGLYTFLPGNELRLELSRNPLDHRHFLRIWRGAYVSTLRRVLLLEHRLRGDLRRHGIELRTERAEAVASQLRATETPDFADFFVDRRVELRTPPLVREAHAASEWVEPAPRRSARSGGGAA